MDTVNQDSPQSYCFACLLKEEGTNDLAQVDRAHSLLLFVKLFGESERGFVNVGVVDYWQANVVEVFFEVDLTAEVYKNATKFALFLRTQHV